MQPFIWDNRFITGLEDVDEQHLRLVDLVNCIIYLVSEGKDKHVEVEAVLAELSDYASFHFDEEESLMQKWCVDQHHVDHQQLQHSQFIEKVGQLWDEHQSAKTPAQDIATFLSSWLANHILGSDQALARQIRNIAKGVPPDRAYRDEQRAK